MKWIYLVLAILFETIGTTFMKLSNGLTKVGFAVLMIIFYVLSLGILSLALKKLEIGAAYAIWSGVGISLITIIGIIFFKETVSIQKIVFILLIIAGVAGLYLFENNH